MIFDTTIAGIPCQCRVTHHRPPVPMRVSGTGMADADAPISAEFEYQILDRKGYRAKWLEAKINPLVHSRLFEEFCVEREAQLWEADCRCF